MGGKQRPLGLDSSALFCSQTAHLLARGASGIPVPATPTVGHPRCQALGHRTSKRAQGLFTQLRGGGLLTSLTGGEKPNSQGTAPPRLARLLLCASPDGWPSSATGPFAPLGTPSQTTSLSTGLNARGGLAADREATGTAPPPLGHGHPLL